MRIRSIRNQRWMGNVVDVAQNDCMGASKPDVQQLPWLLNKAIRRSHETTAEITDDNNEKWVSTAKITRYVQYKCGYLCACVANQSMVFMWDGDTRSMTTTKYVFFMTWSCWIQVWNKTEQLYILSLWICLNTNHCPRIQMKLGELSILADGSRLLGWPSSIYVRWCPQFCLLIYAHPISIHFLFQCLP